MRRALLLFALVAAGCGGSHRDALGGGAALLPANTVAFVAVRGDADWRAFARMVLHRTPPAAPAGADEIDLAVLQGGKLVVFAHAHGTWNGAAHAKPSLADAPNYRQSLSALPGGAVAQGYVRGDVAAQRLFATPGQVVTSTAVLGARFRVVAHPLTVPTVALLRYRWAAAWLTREGLGVRLRSAGPPLAKSNRVRSIEQLVPPYAPALFDEIPADALAVFDLPFPEGSFELVPQVPRQVAQLFPGVDPVQLPASLDAVLQGETALYVRRGGEFTVVTSPPDLGDAEAALRGLGSFLGLTLHRAEIGGQLVLSTSAAGIAAFRGGGEKLSADPAFRKAGFPETVTGLAYVTPAGARILRTRPLVAWAAPDGADPTVTVRYAAR